MKNVSQIFKTFAIIAIIATMAAAQTANLTNGNWLAKKGGSGFSSVTTNSNGFSFTVSNGNGDNDWANVEIATPAAEYNWSGFTSVNIAYTCNNPIKIVFSDPLFQQTGGAFEAELPAAPNSAARTIYLSDIKQPFWAIHNDSWETNAGIPNPSFASRLGYIEGVAICPVKNVNTTGTITNFTVSGLGNINDKYCVSFNSRGGTTVAQTTNVSNGSKISQPSNPTRNGYAFDGWFKDANLTNLWNFASDVVTQDITLFAKWISKSSINLVNGDWFAANGGSGSFANIIAANSTRINFTANNGNGWANIELTTLDSYDWSDFTSVSITYISNSPIKIQFSDPLFWQTGGAFEAELPAAPNGSTTRTVNLSDFKQPSWATNAGNVAKPDFANRLGNIFGVAIAPAQQNSTTNAEITDFTVSGLAKMGHFVSFNSNGATAVSQTKNVADGSKITQPSNPTRNGYAFDGWFKNAALTNLWNFASDVVTQDITLFAKWAPISYTISYELDGGNQNDLNPTSYNVQSGNLTMYPPSKTGYIFDGWYRGSDFLGDPMISLFSGEARNMTLFAKWKVNPLEAQGVRIPPFSTVYTGSQIKLPPLEFVQGQSVIALKEGADYSVSYTNNINVGAANANIIGLGNYSTINGAYSFEIHKRNVFVVWGDPVLGWLPNDEEQAPTAISSDNNFPIKVTGKEGKIGDGYIAAAQLATPNPNVVLINTAQEYSITRRTIEIVWENAGPFIYNKKVQAPEAVAAIDKGDGNIDKLAIVVANRFSQVGAYSLEQQSPALAIWVNPPREQLLNIDLTNTTKDYEILKKPLDIVVVKENGETSDEIVVDKETITDETALLQLVKGKLDYVGFAKDEDNISDNKDVLSGELSFEIQKTSANTRSIEKGEYIVKVKTGGITAKNYSVAEKDIRVSVVGETSIRDVQKSDSRYGIRFKNSVVSVISDKQLEIIDVTLPKEAGGVVEIKVVIYDNTGNVVYSSNAKGRESKWDLTNSSGRIVANGGYLVIAEAKSRSGKVYLYSAKVGVKR
ncbi:MAG: InlB B-repeat-containing protein [Chitinivibrionia bacterium]|nr:InlB B-repeat-containing protein [Chitinivibrionia bacterium]